MSLTITIISGSHRKDSGSRKVANYLSELCGSFPGAVPRIIDLADEPVPLWHEDMWDETSDLAKHWRATTAPVLKGSDGFILISPEWGGMVPAALKNFLLYCTPGDVGHKPALICGVSAGMGGSYPISELRASGYKNNRICFLPEHLIFRNVGKFPEEDKYMQERSRVALQLLTDYAQAMIPLRSQLSFDWKAYPNGM